MEDITINQSSNPEYGTTGENQAGKKDTRYQVSVKEKTSRALKVSTANTTKSSGQVENSLYESALNKSRRTQISKILHVGGEDQTV